MLKGKLCAVCGRDLVLRERDFEIKSQRPGGGIRGPGGGSSTIHGIAKIHIALCLHCGLMYDPKAVELEPRRA